MKKQLHLLCGATIKHPMSDVIIPHRPSNSNHNSSVYLNTWAYWRDIGALSPHPTLYITHRGGILDKRLDLWHCVIDPYRLKPAAMMP